MIEQTKINKTKLDYYNRACALMMKALKEANEKDHKFSSKTIVLFYKNENNLMMDIKFTAVWAVSFWSKNLLQASWRQYRASLIHMAEIMYSDKKITVEDLEKIKALLKKAKGQTKYEIDENRTSSNKKKSFNVKEIKELDEALKESDNTWSNPLRLWIRAGKHTGLRPIEWKNTIYYKDENVLVIKNAKNTNGRSLGEYRTIDLNHLSKEKINDILLHLKVSDNMVNKNYWDEYYKGCSNLLHYTTRKIWPRKDRYPSLYSCRHQFSADMKASGCTKREVAALMGHASDLTAQEHYGRKVSGTRLRKPSVNKNDLNRVKESNKITFKFDKK